jgi:predicted HNH restriction endonuclease
LTLHTAHDDELPMNQPLSEYEGEVNLQTDPVPLCANCHAMAHRRRATFTAIEELKELIEEAKG